MKKPFFQLRHNRRTSKLMLRFWSYVSVTTFPTSFFKKGKQKWFQMRSHYPDPKHS